MADTDTWLNLSISATLVLISGAFAGLTIALMTQNELYLRVISLSGTPNDRQNAQRVITLLEQGKHWILVTLLLGNSIASEALPVVLDRVVGGGLSAVLGSSVLIVIFSEIIPQSICTRHSLNIGACMVPFISACMYLLAPIAWPVGRLLDVLVGDSHSAGYKRTELMTLFSLHERLGSPDDCLHSNEVKMVHGALGLTDKMVTSLMTHIDDVFSLSADKLMDSQTIKLIKAKGYSQIPLHAPGNRMDIIGVLPVKELLKYNPKWRWRAYNFDWTPIPIIHGRTTALNVLKIFQEKKYKILLVGRKEKSQILGVVTWKDLLQTLIGQTILETPRMKSNLNDREKPTIRNKFSQNLRRPHFHPARVQNILEKPQIIAASAPEGELLPLWIKSSFPSTYGSFDYSNSASRWKYIRSYLPDTRTCQEIELATTTHETP